MLKFGIVIPNLNNTKYIKTAIESVLHQDILKEIAIVDGGSTDGIEEIELKYRDVIDYYRSEKDKGQSYAIFDGTSNIHADIFCWLNSDDYFFPYCLDEVARIFETHSEIDVVYGDAVHVDPDGTFISYFHPIKEHASGKIGYDNYICQPACFVRREAYEKIGGINKELIYTMDWDLWCRLAEKKYNFYYLKRPLAAVRYYKGTKTFSNSFRRFWEIIRINLKYGRIPLPVSLVGAYYYELTLKEDLNNKEILYLKYFESLRRIVRKMRSVFSNEKIADSLYGLEKWNNKVKNKCQITFPLYSVFKWKEIEINVAEITQELNVMVNTTAIEHTIVDNQKIRIKLNQHDAQILTIELESKNNEPWQLGEIACR